MLDKLIRMLGSDHDGEVVNAARAIVRNLKASGKDLHWLAGVAMANANADRPTSSSPSPMYSYATKAAAAKTAFEEAFNNLQARLTSGTVDLVFQRRGYLATNADRLFISTLKDRFKRDRERTMLTARELARLHSLFKLVRNKPQPDEFDLG